MTYPARQFTSSELEVIGKDLLGNKLKRFQKSCQDVESLYPNSSNHSDLQKQLLRDILDSLMSTSASTRIKSGNIKGEVIGFSILRLKVDVDGDNFRYDNYRPLVKLIIKGGEDVDFWRAILDLDEKHQSPRAATPPLVRKSAACPDTPITHSSASQKDQQQTRDRIIARVFEEIKFTTYRSVGGFFEKFFGNPDWELRAREIYKSIEDWRVGERWVGLSDTPSQTDFDTWVLNFQEMFLSSERGRFFTTKKSQDLSGSESLRQVDLLVKRSSGILHESDETHNWGDIWVVGEHKASYSGVKGPLSQLAIYIREIFAAQPTRRFVHAFTICGTELETWVFDRSGCYSPSPFNIHKEPLRFVQVLTAYTMMNDEELGLNTFAEQLDNGIFINVEEALSGNKLKLQLQPDPLFCQRAIVCRGTACYLTRALDTEEWDCVTKFSWTSENRDPEAYILSQAKTRGVEGIAQLVGHCLITTIENIRSDLKFGERYTFSASRHKAQSRASSSKSRSAPSRIHQSGVSERQPSQKREWVGASSGSPKRFRSSNQHSSQSLPEVTYSIETPTAPSLTPAPSGPYDNRQLRCLVISPAGRPINKYKSLMELLTAMRDAIKGHRSLLQQGGILHRDVSENNIIITSGTEFAGMLIDMDLAKDLRKKDADGNVRRSGARCRTGTMEFMAIEVLRGESHTYRHDLESFYYVLIWQCGYHGWDFSQSQSKSRQKDNQLHNWYKGSYNEIAVTKTGMADPNTLDKLLREVFPPEFRLIKPLCKRLRDILFPIDTSTHGFFTGTFKDENKMYNEILAAFDDAIQSIRSNGDPVS